MPGMGAPRTRNTRCVDDTPPKRAKTRVTTLPGSGYWYGTTLRIYDPNLDAWRILWNDPATDFFAQQIGRARGNDIVQEGQDPRGGAMRWTFVRNPIKLVSLEG